MSEPNDRDQDPRSERRGAEGVRIIGPEEAQAALDAGAAAGRRPEDELRFGDVPPAPTGPRPPHRFPLPDSVDPAEAVPMSPVVAPPRVDPVVPGRIRASDRHGDGPSWDPAAVDPSGAVDPTSAVDSTSAVDPASAAGPASATDQTSAVDPANAVDPTRVVDPTSAGESEGDDASTPGLDHAAGRDDLSVIGTAPDAAGVADDTAVLGTTDQNDRSYRPAHRRSSSRRRLSRTLAAQRPTMAADPLPPPGAATSAQPEDAPWVVGDPDPAPGPVAGSAAGSEASGPDGGRATSGWSGGRWSSAPPEWPAPTSQAAVPGPSEPSPRQPSPREPSPPGLSAYEPSLDDTSPAFDTPAFDTPAPDIAPAFNEPVGEIRDAAASPDPAPDPARADEGITVSGGFETELPHWTDPPTGEVPRILADRGGDRGGADDEDLAAWEALGSRSTTWRDDNTGWGELDELDNLADDDLRVGALDQTRSEHSDLYSFDEDFERLEEQRSGQQRIVADTPDEAWDEVEEPAARVTRVSTHPREQRPVRTGRARAARPSRSDVGAPRGNELASRLGVGIGLVVLLVIAYAVGPLALLVLSAAVVTAAAAEVYDMLRPSGFRPATLLGLAATVGVVFAAYWRGVAAIPLIVVLVFVASMLWYLFRVVDARPLANVAVTLSAFVWVGVLGSYSALLLRSHHGRGLFLGAVLPAVAADIVAYFTGRWVGSRLLAPSVSPGKTWEGALGGGVAAIVVGVAIGHSVSPWGGVAHGLALGVVVAVLAPIGDLFESMVKRDLSVKDSGSMLSGHGGVLDRFDAVLLVLPATYYLASVWGYVK